MNKIQSFSKQTDFKQLRADINEALVAVGEKHGVTFAALNASYDEFRCTFKLSCDVGNDKEVIQRNNWDTNCNYHGLTKEMYGQEFKSSGKTYRAIGFKPGARKNVVLIEDVSTKKVYVCPPEMIKKGLMVA